MFLSCGRPLLSLISSHVTVVSGSEWLGVCGMHRISPDSEEEPKKQKQSCLTPGLIGRSGLGRAEQHSKAATRNRNNKAQTLNGFASESNVVKLMNLGTTELHSPRPLLALLFQAFMAKFTLFLDLKVLV